MVEAHGQRIQQPLLTPEGSNKVTVQKEEEEEEKRKKRNCLPTNSSRFQMAH
jgi:hypothetical protein